MENSAATGAEGEGGVVENHRTSRSSIRRARWRPCEICFKILLQFRGRTSATWRLCIVFLCVYIPFFFLFLLLFFFLTYKAQRDVRSFLLSISQGLYDHPPLFRGGWDRKKRGSYCWIILDVFLFCYRRVRVSGGSEDCLRNLKGKLGHRFSRYPILHGNKNGSVYFRIYTRSILEINRFILNSKYSR